MTLWFEGAARTQHSRFSLRLAAGPGSHSRIRRGVTWFARDQSVFSGLRPSHEQAGTYRFICRISTENALLLIEI
jgi:hypothetical protein